MIERDDKKIFIQVLPTSGEVSIRRSTRPLRALPADVVKLLITLKAEKTFGDVKNITLRNFSADILKFFYSLQEFSR